LSHRERQVLDLVARGLSNKEIAHELRISPSTVKNHLRQLYDKLDVTSRIDALRAAGLIAT
jgi:LuxR family maltose regulon positive regulatory protein